MQVPKHAVPGLLTLMLGLRLEVWLCLVIDPGPPAVSVTYSGFPSSGACAGYPVPGSACIGLIRWSDCPPRMSAV